MRTRIFITQTSGTVDIDEDIGVSMNFAIADIRNPDKRDTSFTKTIKVPGTANNNKLFGQIFEVGHFIQTSGATNFAPDFNPNLRADCLVFVDEIRQMKGFLKLDNIYLSDKYGIEYECTIWGQLANIFVKLGDTMLQDLNFSAYNHVYNRTNQKATWTNPVGGGYVYPMIDYGRSNAQTFKVTDFFPAIYLREYIQKIFEYAGFQFSSTFFDSTYFKSLCIPFSGDQLRLSLAQIQDRTFRGSRASSNQVSAGSFTPSTGITATVVFNDDNTPPNTDGGNDFNTSTGEWTCPANGWYDFSTVVAYFIDVTTGSSMAVSILASVEVMKTDLSNFSNVVSSSPFTTDSGTINGSFTFVAHTANIYAPSVYVLAGEKVWVRVRSFNTANSSFTGNINVVTGSYFLNRVINNGIAEGDTLEMSNALPPNIKCSDLLLWCIRTWNLYVTEDTDVANKLFIEPYTSFYSSTAIDWTDKLDISTPIKVQPMGALDAKRYVWKFKDDSDYFNDKYKKAWNETYGQKYIDVQNDWLKDTKTIESGFSPTPLALVLGTDRVIPRIYQVDQSGNISPKATNLRLLFYGGVKSTTNSWTYVTGSGTFTEATYPYAGHLDNVGTPTYDINFGVPREVYYSVTSGSTYVDRNIYNEYWRQYMDEVTDRNSKLVTAAFFLSPLDIQKLDFRTPIFVDGYNYRLNKVIDFNPLVSQTTKVELLKIKYGIPYSQYRITMWGTAQELGQDISPSFFDPFEPNDGMGDMNSPTRIGSGGGNRIGFNTSGVTMDASMMCVVGDGCARVSIQNSSGCTVYGGLSDVLILNSSGVTVETSSTTVINNQFYFKGLGTGHGVKGTLGVPYNIKVW